MPYPSISVRQLRSRRSLAGAPPTAHPRTPGIKELRMTVSKVGFNLVQFVHKTGKYFVLRKPNNIHTKADLNTNEKPHKGNQVETTDVLFQGSVRNRAVRKALHKDPGNR